MTLPKMNRDAARLFRRYYEVCLLGIVMANAMKEREIDEAEPTPSSMANEALLAAAGAMDLDYRAIEPQIAEEDEDSPSETPSP